MDINLNDPEQFSIFMLHVVAVVHTLEDELGVSRGTLTRLLDEDDWSVVIKCHALIEATVTSMLSHSLDSRLKRIITKMNLRMKLECAEALELLDREQSRYVTGISEIRNDLAHDPTFIGFTFSAHIAALDSDKQRVFFDRLTAMSPSTVKARDIEYAKVQPKAMLLLTARTFMVGAYAKTLGAIPKFQQRVYELSMEYLHTFQNERPIRETDNEPEDAE